jgi:hypothetical protein
MNAVELPVDKAREAPRLLLRAEEARAHHRRQCQRDHTGHRHRAGEREGELGEEGPREAALKTDRHIDGNQHDGHRENRSAEFARGDQRGIEGALPSSSCAIDVFDDDDRVVHHEPDREHEREQRQQIDRIAEQLHHEERADERQRHRDQRHDDRAEAAEEQENHRVTISSASTSVLMTSTIAVLTKSVAS